MVLRRKQKSTSGGQRPEADPKVGSCFYADAVAPYVAKGYTLDIDRHAAQEERSRTSGAVEMAPPPRHFDAMLLFRCMDVLHINRRELARTDPLLFRELQDRCTLCRNKEECLRVLSAGFGCVPSDRWWKCCPNASLLTTIEAVQSCDQSV